MRQAILTLILAVSVICTASAKPNPLSSIKPLQEMSEEGKLEPFCTTWATRLADGQRVWVAAAHCIVLGEDSQPDLKFQYYIDGKKATLAAFQFSKDPALDVSVFIGGPSAEPLQVAGSNPDPLTPVWTAGYAMGSPKLHVAAGVYGPVDDDGFQQFGVPTAPGLSGGPIVDQKSGMVVGVWRRSECHPGIGWCSVGAGTPAVNLKQYLDGLVSQVDPAKVEDILRDLAR